ncbi:hypothetical protein FIBSPDRAFT_948931 [Athelia psychrophila]|uniref:Xylanolytic transcriptional activator regulatory domain-containing protein n=1 Tax=Athelia psychrophila TaxID=1759441 RepID=A0A166QB70_9AGAM|nr:hypothetical protein FIBSPDRAFT_948931 [Fibularhizoctonia sp. CBS 109695]
MLLGQLAVAKGLEADEKAQKQRESIPWAPAEDSTRDAAESIPLDSEGGAHIARDKPAANIPHGFQDDAPERARENRLPLHDQGGDDGGPYTSMMHSTYPVRSSSPEQMSESEVLEKVDADENARKEREVAGLKAHTKNSARDEGENIRNAPRPELQDKIMINIPSPTTPPSPGQVSSYARTSRATVTSIEEAIAIASDTRSVNSGGSRRLLAAQFQRLGSQIKVAQARVKELQDRLRATSPGDSHPLLQEDTLVLPTDDLQLYNDDSDLAEAMGLLAVDPDGNAKYRGESAASELVGVIESENENTADIADLSIISRQLGHAIADLSKAFPMGLTVCRYTNSEFYPFMPVRSRALELLDIYYKKGTFFNPIERCDLMKTIIEPLYGCSQVASLATIHAHRLSVFFAVLASAAYYDRSLYSDRLAKQYHVLARAALSLETIVREATTASIQALLITTSFMRASDYQCDQEKWLIEGTLINWQIGLQRDSVSWTLGEEENQRRRVLFWELYTMEAMSSLRMGLPPNLSVRHTDCQFPIDTERHTTFLGVSEPGFHDWKRRFSADCMSIAMQFCYSAKPPPYEDLLEVDKRLRHAPIPHHLQCPAEPSDTDSSWSLDPTTAYQQYGVLGLREHTILSIHRSYFAQAVREEPLDLLKHKMAPSVRAAYKSAAQLVSGMRDLHQAHPQVTYEQWWLWPSLYSACIILGALVIKAPRCNLARDALLSLEEAAHLFDKGLDQFRAPPMLDTFRRLLKRSQSTMAEVYESHTFQKSQQKDDTDALGTDEVAILVGGRRSLIKTKLHAKPPPHSHHSSIGPSASQSMSPLPDGSTVVSAGFDPAINFNVARNASSADRSCEFATQTLDTNYGAVDCRPSHLPPVFEHDRDPQYDFMQNYQPPTLPAAHQTSQVYIWTSFVDELMAFP